MRKPILTKLLLTGLLVLVIPLTVVTVQKRTAWRSKASFDNGAYSKSFSIVVFPDGQNYVEDKDDLYNRIGKRTLDSQMKWILDNAASKNIKYVLHLGDMTNNNALSEWNRFKAALSVLDNTVPYALAVGNHDLSATRDTSRFNNIFTKNDWVGKNLGGVMEEGKMDNVYYIFEAASVNWMVMVLEVGPRQSVIDWANKIISTNLDKRVIILTHAYLTEQAKLSYSEHWNDPHKMSYLGSDVNNGTEMYEKLVRKNKNIVLVLNGHYTIDTKYVPCARLYSRNDEGFNVSQQYVNFQNWEDGGKGYMRLLTFYPDQAKISVKTFSPTNNSDMTDSKCTFDVTGLKLTPDITASAMSTYKDKVVQNLLDGNPKTVWNAGASDPQWIILDLQKASTLRKIDLLVSQTPKGNTVHKIEVGDKKDNLKLVKTISGITEDNQLLSVSFDAPLNNIRFIKITTTESPSWIAWKDVIVYR